VLSIDDNKAGYYLMQVGWYDAEGVEVFGMCANFGCSHNDKDFKQHELIFTAPSNTVSVGLFLKANKADGVEYFDSLRVKQFN